MDKVIDEEKEFIQRFAIELTNRTLDQREEIGKKYYKQQKDLLNVQYKLIQALQDIREIAEKNLKGFSENCIQTTPYLQMFKQIQDKINSVIGAE